MTEQEIATLFDRLLTDFDDLTYLAQNRPLLAHYTSIGVLEKIMRDDEIWLSNPLFMEDLEEVRFGVNEGIRLFEELDLQKICESPARASLIRHAFHAYFQKFNLEHALDTYVFCLTEHDPANTDGVLSMWRGYGGRGNGAALGFKTDLITTPNDQSPLTFARVRYASSEHRLRWLKEKLEEWANLLNSASIQDDKLHIAAYSIFYVIKFYALVSKHDGFSEEKEWRIIYMPERDTAGSLKERFGYVVGGRGVEPKLRLKIAPQPWTPDQSWTFGDVLDRVILGPSVSSPLAKSSFNRMLEAIGKRDFRKKVFSSTIPLRPS